MNFEKALEAMKQGKKVHRKAWRDTEIYLSSTTLFTMICDDVFADDWEIYEEPQKQPEMTSEKASKILDLIPDYINVGELEYITHCSFSEIAESVRLAIEALENQNQSKPEKKSKCGFNCKKCHISHENGKESNTTECNCGNDSILDTIAMTKYHLGFTLTADELARASRIEKGNKDNA